MVLRCKDGPRPGDLECDPRVEPSLYAPIRSVVICSPAFGDEVHFVTCASARAAPGHVHTGSTCGQQHKSAESCRTQWCRFEFLPA